MASMENIILRNAKKKILSLLPKHQELQICARAELLMSDHNGKDWFKLNLEGLLCFLLDYEKKTRFFALYNFSTFELLLSFELYENFEKQFQKLSPVFRCFQLEGGFMGIAFENETDAIQFETVIKKIRGNLLKDLFASIQPKQFTEKRETIKKCLEVLKERKDNEEIKQDYNEDYLELEAEVKYFRELQFIQGIEFNEQTRQFEIGEVSEALKQIFIDCGVSKNDLKKMPPIEVFGILRIIVFILCGKEINTTNKIERVHSYIAPEENERIIEEERQKAQKLEQEARRKRHKLNKKTNKVNNKTEQTQKKSSGIYSSMQGKNVPTKKGGNAVKFTPPPPPPPLIINTAKVPQTTPVPNSTPSTSTPTMSREEELKNIKLQKRIDVVQKPVQLTMEEQLRNVKLKQVNKETSEPAVFIKNEEKNFLQNALSAAINLRRKNLYQHQQESDSDSDDDW